MSIKERNNVKILGNGSPTLVFAHGFGCDQTMWRYLVPAFEAHYRIILFDLVGSGQSDTSAYDYDKYSSLDGYASDLIEILSEYADEPVIFIGHSVSATIGMLATITAPEKFAAQIMVGPSPCYVNDGDYIGGFELSDIEELIETMESNYLGWSSTMAPAIMGSSDQPELGEELKNSFCRTDPEIAKHFAKITFMSDHRDQLTLSNTPALIMQCDEDIIAPISVGEYMHEKLPQSELVIIDNHGHCPHLSAPSQSVKCIESFLANLLATAPGH